MYCPNEICKLCQRLYTGWQSLLHQQFISVVGTNDFLPGLTKTSCVQQSLHTAIDSNVGHVCRLELELTSHFLAVPELYN